jgi:hypothetical protein
MQPSMDALSLHFIIEPSQVPSLIPMELAESILFAVTSTFIIKKSQENKSTYQPLAHLDSFP